MKDLREVQRILDIEIERDRVKEKVSLTKKAYLQKVLQKFDVGCEPNLWVLLWPFISSFQLIYLQRLLMNVCLMLHMLVQWVVLCILWCARGHICHKL